MLWFALILAGGLVLLYYGAEWLVAGAASLAQRFGISPVIAGLTVVAYGTSMPELVVSIKAAFAGQSGLALGNIVGSNLFNVGVILGLAALCTPLRVEFRLIRFDIPLMIGLSALFAIALWFGTIERWMGAGFVLLLVAYTAGQVFFTKREKNPAIEAEFAEALPRKWNHWGYEVTFIILGGGLLALGAQWLVDGGVGLARGWGISETIIGLTIIAAGTSAPELAATIVAALRKEADIAVGNIVGSNIFNILSVAGVASLLHPLDASSITRLDILAMLGLSVIMLPLARTGFLLRRWEGCVLLACYGTYLYLIWPVA